MTANKKISVCLCTYNGSRFIEEQLRSILNQSVPVDEICIGDDNSQDDTVQIIERFKAETGSNIHLKVNNPNLGCNANFDSTINRCKGDIIFLSDQDDIWMPDKVKTVMEYFEGNPDKEVVFTNGEFMDEEGNSFTDKKMFDAVSLRPSTIEQFKKSGLALELFIVHNRATGATMALRRSFIGQYNIRDVNARKPGDVYHDHIIVLAAVSQNKLGIITKPLIKYRIHSNQAIGFSSWIENPPASYDIYTVNHSLKFVDYVPDRLKERARMVTDRFYYKKSTLYNNLFRYFHRYIRVYGFALGLKVWYHDLVNAIMKRSNLEW
ncbi:MAG: glycosyltransferase family 2 protein [Prevotella sp.]|nr:glycosyltransferase family 2 protein [Prevotella sp.]